MLDRSRSVIIIVSRRHTRSLRVRGIPVKSCFQRSRFFRVAKLVSDFAIVPPVASQIAGHARGLQNPTLNFLLGAGNLAARQSSPRQSHGFVAKVRRNACRDMPFFRYPRIQRLNGPCNSWHPAKVLPEQVRPLAARRLAKFLFSHETKSVRGVSAMLQLLLRPTPDN